VLDYGVSQRGGAPRRYPAALGAAPADNRMVLSEGSRRRRGLALGPPERFCDARSSSLLEVSRLDAGS
jgi:hypothetical protein